MRRVFLIGYLALMMGLSLALGESDETIVDVQLLSAVDKLKPAESNRIALELNIHKPWHVNAHEPEDEFLIPTEVSFKPIEGISLGKIDYPIPEERTFAFSENPVLVYEDKVYIYTTVTIPPNFDQKSVNINGTVTYQACNDQTCLPPEDLEFSSDIPIAEGDESVKSINTDIFSEAGGITPTTLEDEQEMVEEKSDLVKTIESKGFLIAFIGIFIAGLGLNLTPCVYPLIPITISYFGGQTSGKKGNLLLLSIIYVLGMSVTYSALGLFAGLTGSLLGAWLQNPWVLIFIALVMIALALSMFGLYDIQVPASLANFAGQSKQGYLGTLFMGLTVGIIAAPCIGPFVLGLLTYVGELGDPVMGFLMFFTLAMGLGVPFIFLAMFSGAINYIPRSGAWMVWVKKIFGFILIGMAFYFLEPLFDNVLWYYTLLGITALIAGIYLALIDSAQGTGKAFPVVKNLVGVVFVLLSAFFWVNSVEAYVDERLYQLRQSAGGNSAFAANQIDWQSYSQKTIQTAKANNKPVMIDFYADWCIPCKELDQFTFSDSRVIELSKNFTMIKADLTKSQSPEVKALQKKYEIKGVPTLVFLNRKGKEIEETRVVNYIKADQFLSIMKNVLKKGGGENQSQADIVRK